MLSTLTDAFVLAEVVVPEGIRETVNGDVYTYTASRMGVAFMIVGGLAFLAIGAFLLKDSWSHWKNMLILLAGGAVLFVGGLTRNPWLIAASFGLIGFAAWKMPYPTTRSAILAGTGIMMMIVGVLIINDSVVVTPRNLTVTYHGSTRTIDLADIDSIEWHMTPAKGRISEQRYTVFHLSGGEKLEYSSWQVDTGSRRAADLAKFSITSGRDGHVFARPAAADRDPAAALAPPAVEEERVAARVPAAPPSPPHADPATVESESPQVDEPADAPPAELENTLKRFQSETLRASKQQRATADTPLAVGMRVQAEWGGQMYLAEVVALVAGGQVKIHYVDWSDSFDEIVPRSRLEVDPEVLAKTAHPMRTWTDASGKFKIEGEFIGFKNGNVRLKRASGKEITVPIEKLDDDGQKYVRAQQGTASKVE